ncbi:Protein of unknown function [Cotesia congregata]|uniref:Uncharacterized protein n=1 Tax=Cotesia congregata TaxID=51543 RepID=A0A8J2H8M8_COTCN|nr:Protein of unknown function [Cotesia congregata]
MRPDMLESWISWRIGYDGRGIQISGRGLYTIFLALHPKIRNSGEGVLQNRGEAEVKPRLCWSGRTKKK